MLRDSQSNMCKSLPPASNASGRAVNCCRELTASPPFRCSKQPPRDWLQTFQDLILRQLRAYHFVPACRTPASTSRDVSLRKFWFARLRSFSELTVRKVFAKNHLFADPATALPCPVMRREFRPVGGGQLLNAIDLCRRSVVRCATLPDTTLLETVVSQALHLHCFFRSDTTHATCHRFPVIGRGPAPVQCSPPDWA